MTNAIADRAALRRVLVLVGLALGFWLLSVLLHGTDADARPVSHQSRSTSQAAGTHATADAHAASSTQASGLDRLVNRTVNTVGRTADRTVAGVDRTVTRVVHHVAGNSAAKAHSTASATTPTRRTLDAVAHTVHTTTQTVRTAVHDVTSVATTTVSDLAANKPVGVVVGDALRGLVHDTVGDVLDNVGELAADPAGLPGALVPGRLLTGVALPGSAPAVDVPAADVPTVQSPRAAGIAVHRPAVQALAMTANAHRDLDATTDATPSVVENHSGDGSPASPGPAIPSEGGKPGSPSPARGGGDLGSAGLVTAVTVARNELLEGTFADDERLFGVVAREPGFAPD